MLYLQNCSLARRFPCRFFCLIPVMATSWLFSRRFGGHIPAWASVYPFIHILSGFSVVLVALMTMTPVQAQTTSATYTVTFQGNWTLDSTPDGVVSSAHFTTLVGAVHNDMVTFWESGGTATSGVEGVAELGSTGTFASEVTAAGANASLVEQSIGGSPTATATFEIEVTTDRPLFTLLSMIGPSPDWFVGVSGLSLLDAQNQWVSSREVDLFPYDAGTEDGSEFTLSNSATSPQGTITSIKGTGKFSDEPMAMLSFELQGGQATNAAPAFTGSASFSVRENSVTVGTVQATDSDDADSVTGYAIEAGADGALFSITSGGTLRFRTAPNYEDSQDADRNNRYEVRVRATSGTGDRELSAVQTIVVTVTDDNTEAPDEPDTPSVLSASTSSLTVSWDKPGNGGPPITDYDYRYRTNSPQGNWTEVTNTAITGLSTTISGLSDNTAYDVQVRAKNAEGTSDWSPSGVGTTQAGQVAGAPQNLQAVAGNSEVSLTWDAPNDDGGADITGYAYRYKKSGGNFSDYMDIPDSGPGGANTRSYTVTGLMNEQEYVFHVRAVNEHGGGAPSEVAVMLPAVVNTENQELPAEVTLSGNYPNPFNPETTIRYGLPKAGEVRLAVYNLLGQEVAILVDQSKSAGHHTVRFGAGNLPSGVYVYRLHAGNETIVRTMMLVK